MVKSNCLPKMLLSSLATLLEGEALKNTNLCSKKGGKMHHLRSIARNLKTKPARDDCNILGKQFDLTMLIHYFKWRLYLHHVWKQSTPLPFFDSLACFFDTFVWKKERQKCRQRCKKMCYTEKKTKVYTLACFFTLLSFSKKDYLKQAKVYTLAVFFGQRRPPLGIHVFLVSRVVLRRPPKYSSDRR